MLFILLSLIIGSGHSVTQPNIVIIIGDDLGWNDVGFHGSNEIPTPNIDALAYNGMILNRFYTLPTCTPSRAALLTGYYPIRLGLQGSPIVAGEKLHLPWGVPTLPEKLKEIGYQTHLVGKWHLGAAYRNVTPTMRGFDTHYGYWHGFIGYFNQYAENPQGYEGLDLHDNFKIDWTKQGQDATDLFTKQAEEIIYNHDTNQPLFLVVAHLAAHTGSHGKLEIPNTDSPNQDFDYIADPNRRIYAAIVQSLDKSVGRTVSAIKKKGMLDNTIILFMSDNGAQTFGMYENFGSNWPLRGLKCTVLEGGVRNSAVVYSRLLKKKGVVNNELIHISDLMPTLYAAAGGNPRSLGNIDGINQWNTIIYGKPTARSEILVNIDEVYASAGLIGENGRYKLINGSTIINETFGYFYGDSGRDTIKYNTQAILESDVNRAIEGSLSKIKLQRIRKKIDLGKTCRNNYRNITACNTNILCLFDLHTDPCETKNIATLYPNIVNKLNQRIAYYQRQLVPQGDRPVDPRSNPIYYNNTWITWLDQ